MRNKIFLLMVLAFVTFAFIACDNSDQQEGSDSAGLEWPSAYMSVLPSPSSKISSIEKLNGIETIAEDDTTTLPSSVNVVMNEMKMEEALAYYEKLKSLGFTINTDEKDNDKILLVGMLNDADENPFLFSYIMEENFGNISITMMSVILSNEGGDGPAAEITEDLNADE